jgi:PAS domain S-box-containing protein
MTHQRPTSSSPAAAPGEPREEAEHERRAVERMFPGGGEMGARMRAFDWAATPLGPVSTWPRELRTTVGMVLANPFPMNLLWGPDLIQFYNDAYIPLMGGKHPANLGVACRVTWAEIWPQVGERFTSVLATGVATTHQKTQLFLQRHGFLEEGYFTDSYAPLWGESGQVEGVLVTVMENTEALLVDRRLRTLHDLAAETGGAASWPEAEARVGEVLGRNAADVPFALLYLLEDPGGAARLSLAVGVERGTPASPTRLDLAEAGPWPLVEARRGASVHVDLTRSGWDALPGGPWPEPAREALVLPLVEGEVSEPLGFLVIGLSPRLRLDGAYQDFLRLAARQVATACARLRAKEAQRAAHQQVADILESMGDVFMTVDARWRLTRVNSNHERISGLRREDTLGGDVWELWPTLRLPQHHYWREYHRCMHERVPVHFLDYFESVNLWVETRAYPTPDGGMAVFLRDVSEQKLAESERDLIFTRAPALLCRAGVDGRLQRVNPAWSRVLGWSEAQLLSMTFASLLHPEDAAFLAPGLERLAAGEALVDVEGRLRHQDGSYRWFSWSLTPEPRQGLLFGAGRDVTEARRTAGEFKSRADFEQQLIGIVSHDLRNPLSVITLGAQALLRRESLETSATRTAVRILSAAERASRMVRDLLDFTQARLGGGLSIQPGPVDLHELVRQVLDELQMTFPERDFLLHQQGDARGEWDGDRMVQLLTNLVTNAAKYSPEGSAVSVTTRAEAREVWLDVHNAGAPIAPEVLARLFQPLQRGRNDHSAARSVGLGLYIVKHIVEGHGGRIDVRSTEAEGTTFTVRLPRHPPRREA